MSVTRIIASRSSIRSFTAHPLDEAVPSSILMKAARAPSGGNMQPWRAYILHQPAIARVDAAIRATGIAPHKAEWDDYRYYPKQFFGDYDLRRKALGRRLYNLLGIGRRDIGRMRDQFERNFNFFGAPVGVLITIDRKLEQGSWIDLGMFMQNIVLLAEAEGLGTCVQAAFAPYHKVIRPEVGIGEDEVLVCGIAMGHPDRAALVNTLKTDRAPTSEWLRQVA